jgi:serine/threonine-protein kinase
VFQASHRNGNRVAIKMLHADLAGSEDVRERFLAEGYAANRVAHAGVVTVRDEGTTADGAVFLVMDLLQGQTIAERVRAGGEPLSVGEVLELASQVLDVLVHAHDRGVVHGDIKPENVFLTREDRVRLLNFGVERWADQDARSDLWSLGATLYRLLSGRWVRESDRAIPSLGEVAVLPRSLVAVVDRALSFDREARFPDARSMQLAVKAALAELRSPDSRSTLQPPSLEPMALALSAPRPKPAATRHGSSGVRSGTPAYGSVRPIASTPLPQGAPVRSALPLYVGLGFALGLSIVVTARLNVHSAAPEDVVLPERPAAAVAPPPAPSSAASAATSAPPAAASAAPAPTARRTTPRAPLD